MFFYEVLINRPPYKIPANYHRPLTRRHLSPIWEKAGIGAERGGKQATSNVSIYIIF